MSEPLPKHLSQKTARKLLINNGWTQTLGGKHVIKMTKPGHRPITLPIHKGGDYGLGLTNAILRQAGLKSALASTEEPDKGEGT